MAVAEAGLSRNRIISELTRSSHGNLDQFVPTVTQATKEDPEFVAHLIAWNQIKGTIRDSKIALPAITLALSSFKDEDLVENSRAHLVSQDSRTFLRGLDFHKSLCSKLGTTPRAGHRLVESYLKARESNWNWWEKTALQHRNTLKTLYARYHVKPNPAANNILFGTPPVGTLFDRLSKISQMTDKEAAQFIVEERIPFLTAMGSLGKRAKSPDLLLALIDRMTPTELTTNSAMLYKLGVNTEPALRAAYEAGLKKASEDTKATFKTTRAAEALAAKGENKAAAKLAGLQEKQIDKLGGVDGDWLVLGDKSGSMAQCIEVARQIAATLARVVKGQVHLIFFDNQATYFDATGKTYDELKELTRRVTANGGTSVGVGVGLAMSRGLNIDGIAVVSDMEENGTPRFADKYAALVKDSGKEPPVYLYNVGSSAGRGNFFNTGRNTVVPSLNSAGIEYSEFNLGHGAIDFYALGNIVSTMRADRYKLSDEINSSKLLTVAQVLASK